MHYEDALANLTKDQLIELVHLYAKDLIALDGYWFQSVESTHGMDRAMFHNDGVWGPFSATEARRIKAFLELPDNCGLPGLAEALRYKCTSLSNAFEIELEDDMLRFKITDCRVQNARLRKGMPFHPCKSTGIEEYNGFAQAIDARIATRCLSCFPDIQDDGCNCSWEFTLSG